MILLNKLGLISLLAIIIYVIIYLIRQNYKQKEVSTTYIFTNALKIAKKNRKISKLARILTIILQILIILASIFILSNLYIKNNQIKDDSEIIILDGSYKMKSEYEDISRFSRAINKAKDMSNMAIKQNKKVSIIISDNAPRYIVKNETSLENIEKVLNETKPLYSYSNIEKSVSLVNKELKINPLTKVSYITGDNYLNSKEINIVNISNKNEFNYSVISFIENEEDNLINFDAKVIIYGSNKVVNVKLTVNNVNNKKIDKTYQKKVDLKDGIEKNISFKNLEIFSYGSAKIEIISTEGKDALIDDNYLMCYPKKQNKVKVLYLSDKPNSFIISTINTISSYREDYEIVLDVKKNVSEIADGYDFYIFETISPNKLPEDGFVLLIDQNKNFDTLGLSFDPIDRSGEFKILKSKNDKITDYLNLDREIVTKYKKVISKENFETLLNINKEPILLISSKDRVGVLSLNLIYTTLPLNYNLQILMKNLFYNFIPEMVNKTNFEILEDIELKNIKEKLIIKSDNQNLNFNGNQIIKLDQVGEYLVSEKLFNKTISRNIFVTVPQNQRNIKIVKNNLEKEITRGVSKANGYEMYLVLSSLLFCFIIVESFLYLRQSV